MLRKFAIIIPVACAFNDPAALGLYGTSPLAWAGEKIVAEVEGYTQSEVHGVWKGPQGLVAEAGYRLDFAGHCPDHFVRGLAQYLVQHTNEQCVYVEYDGGAEII